MGAFRMGRADLTGKVVEEEATLADKISDPLKFLTPRCKKLREADDPLSCLQFDRLTALSRPKG
jgi:hypothetical protein